MENLQQVSQLRRAVDPVPELKDFDSLTGLAVRELFRSRLDAQWARYQREQRPLAVLLANLDGFRDYLAQHHKSEAHAALAATSAEVVAVCRRRADFAGRVRSDEFALMLSDVDGDGAVCVAEGLRSRIEGLAIDFPGSPTGGVLTVSIGIACLVPQQNRFARSLVIMADRALAEAKRGGRNRVVRGRAE